jgi:hypothetical protein
MPEADSLAIQPVFGRADVASADHRLATEKLATGYQS